MSLFSGTKLQEECFSKMSEVYMNSWCHILDHQSDERKRF